MSVLARFFVFTALLTAAAAGAQTLPDLPAAPAAPAAPAPSTRPNLSLPPALPGSRVVLTSHGDAPPSTPDEPDECYAPATGIYASFDPKKLSPELRQQLLRFNSVAASRIDQVWTAHMPRAEKDPWVRKATVTVRFAILPSGEIDPPLVTISSGRRDYDKHAVEAILGAAPFDPLPAGVREGVAFCMQFKYLKSTPDPKTPYWDYQVPTANTPQPAAK